MSPYSQAVRTAQAYYNSDDAENFYSRLWGGEDIHIGLYQSVSEPVIEASNHTVEATPVATEPITILSVNKPPSTSASTITIRFIQNVYSEVTAK